MYQKRGALAELSFHEVSTGLKNLSGHIVHPQPFNIFRCSQGTLNGYASEFSNGEGDVILDDAPQHSVALLKQRVQPFETISQQCCNAVLRLARNIVVANSSERSNFQAVENSSCCLFDFLFAVAISTS